MSRLFGTTDNGVIMSFMIPDNERFIRRRSGTLLFILSNKSAYILIISAAITSLLLSVTIAEHVFAITKEKFNANLQGENEIPPVNTTVNADAKIKVKSFSIDGRNHTAYGINITGISDPTGVHIHMGKKNESGPVVYDLLKGSISNKTTIATHIHGKISESGLTGPMVGNSTSDLISSIKSGDAYVDVHSIQYPNGEIRGQLKQYGIVTAATSTNATAATSTNATAATSTNATAATDDAEPAFISPSTPQ